MKKSSLIILFILGIDFISPAQYIDMKFIDILNRKQLTNSFCSCITQDNDGFIWIGTTNGLNRFDGYDTKQYLNNHDDSLSLPGNNIRDIYIDGTGQLWITTLSGICMYNKEKDNFNIVSDGNNLAGLPSTLITKINSNNNILFVSV